MITRTIPTSAPTIAAAVALAIEATSGAALPDATKGSHQQSLLLIDRADFDGAGAVERGCRANGEIGAIVARVGAPIL